MEIFRQIMEVFAAVPDWVPLILCPALTVAAAVAFAIFGGRRGYPLLAGILGAVGVALMSAGATVAEALCYAALFALIACAAGLLLLLPRCKKRMRRTSRDERIYQRFRAELENAPVPAANGQAAPVKECCFEPAPAVQEAPELNYALSLLEKLRRGELSATDRLEADMLGRTLSAMQGRLLTAEEKNTLNDCLASVLKLTAKYKL